MFTKKKSSGEPISDAANETMVEKKNIMVLLKTRVMALLGKKKHEDDEAEEPVSKKNILVNRYGHIDTKFFHYVTPGMIISVTVLVAGIASGFSLIKGYFMHNPPLNGILLLLVIVGLWKGFGANIAIWNVARFLKKVEIIQSKGSATPEEVAGLRKDLEKRAHLLSMAPVSAALNNLATYGQLNLKDDTARLIKSKFGTRIAHLRSNVNYFCGIMVMLGLIGTFWGLLKTISDVGGAMTKISDSMGSNGGNIDMGEFLQSISKPLEGMGVGFSASLFGLGGSLFLGFFGYIAAYAHDHFIENFGRWLDDRIPTLSPTFATQMKSTPLPGSDDLKAWLAGFVFLAKESNQRMSQLFTTFVDANQINTKNLQHIETLYNRQHEVLAAVESGNQKLTGIHNTLKSFVQDTGSQYSAISKIHSALPQLTDAVNSQTKTYQHVSEAQAARLESLMKQAQQFSANLTQIADGQHKLEQTQSQLAANLTRQSDAYRDATNNQVQQLALMAGQLQQWSSNFAQIGDVHSGLLNEIKTIKRTQPETANVAEISSLIVQVNALLDEIGEASDDGLMEIFRKNTSVEQDPPNNNA